MSQNFPLKQKQKKRLCTSKKKKEEEVGGVLLSAQDFGYVNLKTKVLDDYLNHFVQDERRRVRWKGGQDLDIVSPSALLTKEEEEGHPEVLTGIGDILNNPQMSISQKYKNLGVKEDPFEEDEEQDGLFSCWQWFLYKMSRFYSSQWPMSTVE